MLAPAHLSSSWVLLPLDAGNAEAIGTCKQSLYCLVFLEHLKDLQRPRGPMVCSVEVWFWFKVTWKVSLWGPRIWTFCCSTRGL